jgi:ASC-1-like (ASCH) protein/predicted ATPase
VTGGPARRYVITGGPSAGKETVIEAIIKAGLPCSAEEAARNIYKAHRARIGRHLRREDRREYSREVLAAFVAEYTTHTSGVRFYNRGIPDGYGWDRFFGLEPYPELEEANRTYRYDTVLVLDPLDRFEDEQDVVWAKEREIRHKRYFDLIASGTKTIEIRVAYPSNQRLTAGGLIRFVCRGEECITRITRITAYATFEDLFDHEDPAAVNPTATRAEQLVNVRLIYPADKEALGVLAIEVERV